MDDVDKVRNLQPLIDEATDKIFHLYKLINELGQYKVDANNDEQLLDFAKVKTFMLQLQLTTKTVHNKFRENGTLVNFVTQAGEVRED